MSRRDDERVAGILDAASAIAEVIESGRDAWDKDRTITTGSTRARCG